MLQQGLATLNRKTGLPKKFRSIGRKRIFVF